jgi:3-methylcrotonyl-CoA carboxylase alpha subunit
VREGDAISPFYDSMIAKLIVHGDTREQALARLDEALAADPHRGPGHQCAVPAPCGAQPVVCQGRLDTALIPREKAVLFQQEPVGLPLPWPLAVAHTLLRRTAPAKTPTPSAAATAGARTA